MNKFMQDGQITDILDAKLPVIETTSRSIEIIDSTDNDDEMLEDDFNVARATILEAFNIAQDSIKTMNNIATVSESNKDFDTLNNILKTVISASNNLMKIHQQKRKMKKVETTPQDVKNVNNINNAIFVGSSSDLRKSLKDT
jgi:hypothetical protein